MQNGSVKKNPNNQNSNSSGNQKNTNSSSHPHPVQRFDCVQQQLCLQPPEIAAQQEAHQAVADDDDHLDQVVEEQRHAEQTPGVVRSKDVIQQWGQFGGRWIGWGGGRLQHQHPDVHDGTGQPERSEAKVDPQSCHQSAGLAAQDENLGEGGGLKKGRRLVDNLVAKGMNF